MSYQDLPIPNDCIGVGAPFARFMRNSSDFRLPHCAMGD
jgi:hypothetical protein